MIFKCFRGSTMQVSRAVARLTVNRASQHNLQRRGSPLSSNIPPRLSRSKTEVQFRGKMSYFFDVLTSFPQVIFVESLLFFRYFNIVHAKAGSIETLWMRVSPGSRIDIFQQNFRRKYENFKNFKKSSKLNPDSFLSSGILRNRFLNVFGARRCKFPARLPG